MELLASGFVGMAGIGLIIGVMASRGPQNKDDDSKTNNEPGQLDIPALPDHMKLQKDGNKGNQNDKEGRDRERDKEGDRDKKQDREKEKDKEKDKDKKQDRDREKEKDKDKK